MRYELFDYQRQAAASCLENLARGKRDWARGHRSSFALSAITGAGKTVIAATVIEALFHGSPEFGVSPDPRATFLWVTDDPALNRQTRSKMLMSSDLLQPSQLAILDDGFVDDVLLQNRVYFLNIQKLSKTAGLSQGGTNLRQHSFWEILGNTIRSQAVDLYVVLDEAHRGMRPSQGRKTIVQQIIGGKQGANPSVPIVWGISATIERFRKAMEGAVERTGYPSVQVDIDRVRASGLVKDEIGLDEPDEQGDYSATLLREAVKATLDYEHRWLLYATANAEPVVKPVLVLQVPDLASDAKIGELVEVLESEWPGLGPLAVAHVFGEHEPIVLESRTLRWVHPESIQDDVEIRVVMAKTAISTGWDCPRAEVLYSERPANDATHIAQVIGRMIRQPLAHRIATDDALNSVMCFLPKFDRAKLGMIKAELEGAGTHNGDQAIGAAVIRDPKVFERNSALDPAVFTILESLTCLTTPDVLASPLRRARVLAQLLTDNNRGSAMLADAGQQLTKALNSRLDGLDAEHREQVEVNIKDIRSLRLHQSRLSIVGEELGDDTREIAIHYDDVNREVRKIIKSVKEGAGQNYLAHRVAKAGEGADKFETRLEVAALLMIDGVISALDDAATKWVRDRLTQFSAEIKNTTGAAQSAFLRVQEQTVEPEPVDLILRDNLTAATRDGEGDLLPTYPGHLFADDDGEYPVSLNEWERRVVETEIRRPSFVGWYRNPGPPTAAAVRIAYQTDEGAWTSLQPDFIIVSRKDDGSFGLAILDPHGDHLADAKNKLKALAGYAEQFGSQLVRIESISQASDGSFRSLDLMDPKVREVLERFTGAEVGALYEHEVSLAYQ